MKKRNYFIVKILTAAVILVSGTSCQPVSDEAFISALRATSSVPYDDEYSSETEETSVAEESAVSAENTSVESSADETEAEATSLTRTEPTPVYINPADLQPLYDSPSVIEAPYGLCFNLTDGIMIYGKNIDEKMYPASVTKLLTALVALKNVPEDFIFTVGGEIWLIQPGSSVASLKVGQKLGFEAALTALLAASGNDAALTIAVNVAKQKADNPDDMTYEELVDYFVGLMNEYIQELELNNSHFANPDGYHHDNHFSTLRDLLKICIASANNSLVSEISNNSNPTVTFESGETVTWENYLPLRNDEEWGIRGLKIGYTDEAKRSFAALSEIDGKLYISIVSGCTAEGRDNDTKTLLNIARYGFNEELVSDYVE